MYEVFGVDRTRRLQLKASRNHHLRPTHARIGSHGVGHPAASLSPAHWGAGENVHELVTVASSGSERHESSFLRAVGAEHLHRREHVIQQPSPGSQAPSPIAQVRSLDEIERLTRTGVDPHDRNGRLDVLTEYIPASD